MRARGIGAEAACFHGSGELGGTANGEHQQAECLGKRTRYGVTVTEAARALGQTECSPVLLQQGEHAQSGQTSIYESRREMQNLHQSVSQIGGVKAQRQNHARHGYRRHPDGSSDGEIYGSFTDDDPAALPQNLA